MKDPDSYRWRRMKPHEKLRLQRILGPVIQRSFRDALEKVFDRPDPFAAAIAEMGDELAAIIRAQSPDAQIGS